MDHFERDSKPVTVVADCLANNKEIEVRSGRKQLIVECISIEDDLLREYRKLQLDLILSQPHSVLGDIV